MAKTFFITTAIDYTNSAPHIGHAYEKILADVIARYHRLKGEGVFFLTGVDQHGQKVQQSAEKEGVPPEQFVAGVTEQRSEERRVGKECRSRRSAEHERKKRKKNRRSE